MDTIDSINMRGLRYNGLSVILMQLLAVENFEKSLLDTRFIRLGDNEIDSQIFETNGKQSPVSRYKLPSFNYEVRLDNNYENRIKGKMFVECSVFFGKTMAFTLRAVLDDNQEFATKEHPLTTDQLIEFVAMTMGAEHWNSEGEKTASNINLTIPAISLSGLLVDENGNWVDTPLTIESNGGSQSALMDVIDRYKKALTKGQKLINYRPLNYVYIDIWESIDNFDGSLQKMELESDMITFIQNECKQELVGLMTLYPAEWPYRTKESFDEVCGFNIAIDTDDLVLLNTNMCVVFGTYGRRAKGSPTDWKEHLTERKRYHVSWPEYLLLLEMVLAKKYTIDIVSDYIIKKAIEGTMAKDPRQIIESSSSIEINISQELWKLEAVNYSKFMSHKVMFDRTIKRLEIEKEEENLKSNMDRLSNSLNNLCEMRSLKQANIMNVILGAISVASLFQILLADISTPFLRYLGFPFPNLFGLLLVFICLVLVVAGGVILFKFVKHISAGQTTLLDMVKKIFFIKTDNERKI